MTKTITLQLIRACAILLLSFATLVSARTAGSLTPDEAAHHIGEKVEVCGVVASTKYSTKSRGQPTFLNLGHAYPKHIFTVLIWGSDRGRFDYAPEALQGQKICVKGTITTYRGKPQIIVSSPSQIHIPTEK